MDVRQRPLATRVAEAMHWRMARMVDGGTPMHGVPHSI